MANYSDDGDAGGDADGGADVVRFITNYDDDDDDL